MKKNLYKIAALLLVAAIGVLAIRLFVTVAPQKPEENTTDAGVEYIVSQESQDAAAIENEMNKKEEESTSAAQSTEKKTVEDGNFKAAFADAGILICGDSIVKAIAEYGYLDDSLVIAKVGGSTYFLKESLDSVIAANPQHLVLHFGENEVGSKEGADSFVRRYSECIAQLQESLPNTKIYVDSIFPVEDFAAKRETNLVNIEYYNEKMKQMAAELQVTYLDFTPQWASFTKDYYDADGIHPKGSYYPDQYLPYIYAEVQN